MPSLPLRRAFGAALAVLAFVPATVVAQAAPPAAARAELILTNARIYTVDENRPMAEAMAVAGGRILFVGSERGAMSLRGPSTNVINLDGQTVIPGMID